MKKIFEEILKSSEGRHSDGVLYAGAVGIILSDIIPTPAEAVFYYRERDLKQKWEEGKITPQQYYRGSYKSLHIAKSLWWIGVLGAMYFKKGTTQKKAMFGLALVGGGAIAGIIYRNMRKDFDEVKADVKAELEPKQEFAGTTPKPQKGTTRKALRRGNTLKFVA
jgi:hypothetical protein